MATGQVVITKTGSRRRWKQQVARRSVPYIFIAPAVLTLGFLLGYPIVWVAYMTLWDNFLVVRAPVFVGLENLRWLFNQEVFSIVFSNTLIFTLASVILHLASGLGLAVLLNARIDTRLRSAYRGILILPWMFTMVVVALNWRLMLHPFGIFNALLSQMGLISLENPVNWLGEPALAMPAIVLMNWWKGYPFVMLMFLAALQSIPTELYEAASVDGAGSWARFWHVTIPSIRPVIASVGLLDAIWNFRLFDLVYLTTGGGPMNATHVLATYTYRLAFMSFEFSKASALAVVMVLFTAVLTVFYFRYQRV